MLMPNELESARAVYRVARNQDLVLKYDHHTLTAVPAWSGGDFTQKDVFAWADVYRYTAVMTACSIVVAMSILDSVRPRCPVNPRTNPQLCLTFGADHGR